jgi:membrane protein implicated in regulation of membrane protease activity
MAGNEGTFTGALILRVVVIAVIIAVIATFLQRAVFGYSNPAITGAVTSAVAVITLMAGNRRRQERLRAEDHKK